MPIANGISALTLCGFGPNTATANPTASQELIVGLGAADGGAIPIDWDAIGGTTVRVGVSGYFQVGTNPVTINLRVGGTPALRQTVAGTVHHTFNLSVGNTLVDQLSAPFTIPVGRSYLQVCVSSVSGSTLDVSGLTAYIIPDSTYPGKILSSAVVLNGALSEVAGNEWLVDFDSIDATSIKIALAARTNQAVGETGTYRVRIGGTLGNADGTSVLAYTDGTGTAGDGHITGASDTLTKPTGFQLVKLSAQSAGGFAVSTRGSSILIRGAD